MQVNGESNLIVQPAMCSRTALPRYRFCPSIDKNLISPRCSVNSTAPKPWIYFAMGDFTSVLCTLLPSDRRISSLCSSSVGGAITDKERSPS